METVKKLIVDRITKIPVYVDVEVDLSEKQKPQPDTSVNFEDVRKLLDYAKTQRWI